MLSYLLCLLLSLFPSALTIIKNYFLYLACEQPKNVGVGDRSDMIFYYNKATDTCEKMLFKGAMNNDNFFYDYYTCEDACKLRPTPKDGENLKLN